MAVTFVFLFQHHTTELSRSVIGWSGYITPSKWTQIASKEDTNAREKLKRKKRKKKKRDGESPSPTEK